MAATALKKARAEAGRAGRQDDVSRSNGIHTPVGISLDFLAFRTVLLNEVRLRDTGLDRRYEADARWVGVIRQPHSIEHGPRGCDTFTQPGFSPRRRIGGNDLQPASQEERDPTRPDEASADDTHTFDCTLCHLYPFRIHFASASNTSR
jgi:hypothetical protein